MRNYICLLVTLNRVSIIVKMFDLFSQRQSGKAVSKIISPCSTVKYNECVLVTKPETLIIG